MTSSEAPPVRLPNYAIWLALTGLCLVVLRSAWMSDDAYISLRTVDNIVHGQGATWNPGERVQAYTHPLWMLLLTLVYAVTREAFVTPMLLGVVVSVLAVAIVSTRLGGKTSYSLLAVLALVMSRSFVDYSTSGLENSLSYLMVGLLYVTFLSGVDTPRQTVGLVLWGSLLALNRLDLALFAAPPILAVLRKRGLRASIWPMIIGGAPLLAWEIFSLIYYGSLVPNTALAKLDNGLSSAQLWRQGAVYLVFQLRFDPLSLVLISSALAVGVVAMFKRRPQAILAVGLLLYLVYICKVGGDFMAGRFLSVPVFASVCILVSFVFDVAKRRPTHEPRARQYFELGGLAAFVLAVGYLADTPGPLVGRLKASIGPSGIVDERQFWGQNSALIGLRSDGDAPYSGLTGDGLRVAKGREKVVVRQSVGAFGYYAGPDVYIVDRYSLADAFLARLPVARVGSFSRPGHYPRIPPPGYVESLKSGEYRLLDPKLEQLWALVRLVDSGPLFSAERWAAIWALNTGQTQDLVNRKFYAKPYFREVPLWVLSDSKPDGYGWNHPGVVLVSAGKGLQVKLDGVEYARKVKVAADHNDQYTLRFLRDGQEVGNTKVDTATGKDKGGLQNRLLDVPQSAQSAGFDTLHFLPKDRRDKGHAIGYVELIGDAKG